MRVEKDDRILRIGDVEVEFAADVGEVIEIEGAVVVQLDTLDEADRLDSEVYRRNVRCIERDGSTRWLIERAEPSQGEFQPYTGLWKEADSVWVYNWNGIAYEVDLTDGSHRDSRVMK